jgi:hypothetical protein
MISGQGCSEVDDGFGGAREEVTRMEIEVVLGDHSVHARQ